jgi:1-acyl-sn-glycerol-3-phosphate acyltransferase
VSEDTLIAGAGSGVAGAEILRERPRPLRALRALARLIAVGLLVGSTNALAGLSLRLAAAPERLARAIYRRLAGLLVRLLGVAAVVEGQAPEGLCVVVANHRSYVDIPLLMSTMPSIFLAKIEIAGWPLFGTAARLTSTVFVDRDDPVSRRRAFAALGEVLDRGERVVVFPEGTTSTGPGCLPFRTGAFRLAAVRDLPIVPVAIAYHDRDAAWVDDSSFVAHFLECFRAPRVAVSVTIGHEIRGRDAAVVREQAEHWVRGRLAATDGPC